MLDKLDAIKAFDELGVALNNPRSWRTIRKFTP